MIHAILDSEGRDSLDAFHQWWVDIQREHTARRGLAQYITALLTHQGEPTMEVKTRTVPERKVAFIGKELFQPELDTFVMTSVTTNFDHLVAHGIRTRGTTVAEPTYLVFHSPVTFGTRGICHGGS